MKIQIDSEELQRFIRQTKEQQDNLQQVMQQVDKAVKGRGDAFNSPAADRFEQHWNENMAVLKQLQDQLEQMVAKLNSHKAKAMEWETTPFK